MVYRKYHFAATTAGTKITANTSGFVTPAGYDRIGHIWITGADHEHLEITFPKGDHPFNMEEVPCLGEIAVNTRVNQIMDFPNGGKAWCGWRTQPGQHLDITPRGGESSDNSTIIVEYLSSGDNFGIYSAPPIHWIAGDDVTYGTTTNNTKIADIPPLCKKLMWWVAHGAGSDVAGIMLEKNGTAHVIKSNHGAENACEEAPAFEYMNLPRSDFIYHYNDTNLYTGTGVLRNFFGYSY